MKTLVLLGAFLLSGCSLNSDRQKPDAVADELITEPPSPADLSVRFFLVDPDDVTASTFAEGVSVTAVYEIENRDETADCMASSSGPIVSFHLYEGETELASSTRGMMFLTVMTPFEITTGIHRHPAVLQNLRVDSDERMKMIPAGNYSVVARPHFGCGQDERQGEIEYAFAVTK